MKKFEITVGQRPMSFETGRVAKQADGSILCQYGDTVVLAAVCGSSSPKEGADFFPLTCDYQEKAYAGGKIPGGYFKREGKATEKETLTSRLIDRPIRPLFPEGYTNEVQVTVSVLSTDKENNADIVAMNAVSAALMVSGLPYQGPMAACRVGQIDGKFILNPTYKQLAESDLDIIVATTDLGIVMIEAGASVISEERIVESLEFATEQLKPLLKLQMEMQKTAGKPVAKPFLSLPTEEVLDKVRTIAAKEIDKINRTEKTKESRDNALTILHEKVEAELLNVDSEDYNELRIGQAFHAVEHEEVRKFIVDNQLRTDGRKFDEIRKISVEVGVLPRTHGSALFTRGQTQSLGVATLGTEDDEQMIDAIEGDQYKSFMLHYNFPSFSVGEIKPNRGPGRREIGHGALAERSLRAVMPSKKEFPYVVRLVSEILESNGSSSMATVCSGCLAMMDAGVPIQAPVAGIAMGLFTSGKKFAVLSDIAGVEDHLGDMDFKVAGTEKGVTALQLDIKLKESLEISTLEKALAQAKAGRLHILKTMTAVLAEPKSEVSKHAPRIETMKVDPDKIREIIGPGGKMIRKITQESGAEVQVEDDGTVKISSTDPEARKKAMNMISGITAEAEVGKVYRATVKRLMNFGAFCEILPGKEGLVHVSELSEGFVENVESAVKVGDEFDVKVIEVDHMGRINLSKKQATMEGPPIVRQREPRRENGKGFDKSRSRRP